MATLIQLAERQELIKLDPVLKPTEQELRLIYLSPRLRAWLENDLPGLGSTWNIEQSPAEQLDALFVTFCSGEILTYADQFKPIRHVGGGVWELKTADVRVLGFFKSKDCFVGVLANSAQRIKEYNLYHGHAGEVVYFRDNIDLDEPKFIASTDPRDVVSAYTYP